MLDKQFNSNPEYGTIVNQNYIAFKTQSDYPGGMDLLTEYNAKFTPTVVLAESDGSEIDRIVGFDEAEDFLMKLTGLTNNVDTFTDLKKKYENSSFDILTAFKLASKYIENKIDTDIGKEILQKILADPVISRAVIVPFEENSGIDVNVYEYSLFLNGENERLLKEFPETPLKENAYVNISSMARFTRDLEKTTKFYNKALEEFPENKSLLFGHLQFTTRNKTDVKRGLETAVKLMKLNNGAANSMIFNSYAQLLELNNHDYELMSEYTLKYLTDETNNYLRTLFYFADFWMERDENSEYLKRAIEIMISIKPDGPGWLSMLYKKHNKANEAIDVYGSDYIKDYWNDADQLYKYASSWYHDGKNLESALDASKRAVELKPKHEYYALLSNLLRRSGEYNESLKAIEKAIELADETYKLRYQKNLDSIKKKIGERKK